MCFSASASFTAAAVLLIIGVLTLRQVKSRTEYLLASYPLFFSAQQFVEGLLWLKLLDAPDQVLVNNIFAWVFLILSCVLWLLFLPSSVYLIEPDKIRKRILGGFFFAGLSVSMYNLYFIIINGIQSQILCCDHISYSYFLPYLNIIRYIYAAIMILPWFICSERRMFSFGIAIIVTFIISQVFFYDFLISVWCFFAAIVSIMTYFLLRYRKPVRIAGIRVW